MDDGFAARREQTSKDGEREKGRKEGRGGRRGEEEGGERREEVGS